MTRPLEHAARSNEPTLRHFGSRLAEAARGGVWIAPLSMESILSIDDAYEVQAELVSSMIAVGKRTIGWKLALTTRGKQAAMGLTEPAYGVLFESDRGGDFAAGDSGHLIQPRAEPEIVFQIGTRLAGPGVSAADVLLATDWVYAGIEIVDSRFSDSRITASDLIADNSAAADFVLGRSRLPSGALDWADEAVDLIVDGATIASAKGAATMGHPAVAVAYLANWLGDRGQGLECGDLVFTGALTDSVALAGHEIVEARFASLGDVSVLLRGERDQ